MRHGRRAGSPRLVVHLHRHDDSSGAEPALVGFVVSKAVGPAVVRNRVKRQLRHLAREVLEDLPGSAVLVVRAQPRAAGSSYASLRSDLHELVGRVSSAGRRQ